MNELVLIDSSDPAITVLTLNRPGKRNALSIELIEQLGHAVRTASDDRTRRAIVLRANGPSFCAGLDLAEAMDAANAHRSAEALAEMYHTIAASPLITIGAAHGSAVGGGAGLLAACDFIVGADDLRVGYPEVHRGLVAALVTTLLLRQFNQRVVRELVLLGQTVTAARALELGLINRIGGFDVAMQLARDACAGAPGAIARSKRLLDALAPRPLAEDLRVALDFHLRSRQAGEAAEGMAAFLEKRPPRWGARPEDSEASPP
jgi:methylglutaconyl-CoA hydratase